VRVAPVGRIIAAAALTVAAMSGIAACGSGSSNASAPATPTRSASTGTSPLLSGRVAVTISNYMFMPMSLTVKPGTTVTWTNDDSVDHTVTSTSKVFTSGNIAHGKSFSYTFTKPGTYEYMCTIHPFMTASVVVR
jgi:plastocyanin